MKQKEPALPYRDLLMLFRRVSEDSGYKEALLRMALPTLREHPEQATLVTAIEEILWLDEADGDDDTYEVDDMP